MLANAKGLAQKEKETQAETEGVRPQPVPAG
jgi:hypothetical protein